MNGTTVTRGRCPRCEYEPRISTNGVLEQHDRVEREITGTYTWGPPCTGEGMRPVPGSTFESDS